MTDRNYVQQVTAVFFVKGGGTTGARGALAPLMLWPYNTDCLLK